MAMKNPISGGCADTSFPRNSNEGNLLHECKFHNALIKRNIKKANLEKNSGCYQAKNLELWKQSDLRDPSASDANNGKGGN